MKHLLRLAQVGTNIDSVTHLRDLESLQDESGSNRGCLPSVTVEEPPISFSPFSSADCTMLNHFSFNDFIAIAFPDIAGDLNVQI